jgi:hypothetical protein
MTLMGDTQKAIGENNRQIEYEDMLKDKIEEMHDRYKISSKVYQQTDIQAKQQVKCKNYHDKIDHVDIDMVETIIDINNEDCALSDFLKDTVKNDNNITLLVYVVSHGDIHNLHSLGKDNTHSDTSTNVFEGLGAFKILDKKYMYAYYLGECLGNIMTLYDNTDIIFMTTSCFGGYLISEMQSAIENSGYNNNSTYNLISSVNMVPSSGSAWTKDNKYHLKTAYGLLYHKILISLIEKDSKNIVDLFNEYYNFLVDNDIFNPMQFNSFFYNLALFKIVASIDDAKAQLRPAIISNGNGSLSKLSTKLESHILFGLKGGKNVEITRYKSDKMVTAGEYRSDKIAQIAFLKSIETILDTWECGSCHYVNSSDSYSCEMCRNPYLPRDNNRIMKNNVLLFIMYRLLSLLGSENIHVLISTESLNIISTFFRYLFHETNIDMESEGMRKNYDELISRLRHVNKEIANPGDTYTD